MKNALRKSVSLFLLFILYFTIVFPVYGLEWNKSSILKEKSVILHESSILSESSIQKNSSILHESGILKKSSILKESSITGGTSIFNIPEGFEDGIIGTYLVNTESPVGSAIADDVVRENVVTAVRNPVAGSVVRDSLVGGYSRFLEVTLADPNADFADYFISWYSEGADSDFFEYSQNVAEQKQKINELYRNAVKKFGIGTAVVAATWIVAWIVPGGSVMYAAVLSIAKVTTVGAISGAISGAAISGLVAYAKGEREEELFASALSGAADGYMVGAITGAVRGTFTAVKTFSHAVAYGDKIITKNGAVLDLKGKYLGKSIRFNPEGKADDLYYIAKDSVIVLDKTGKAVGNVAKNTAKGNYVIYNESGKVLGFLDENLNLVSYNNPAASALIKGQHRADWSKSTKDAVAEMAKLNGAYNPKTGNFIDANTGKEILGTPEMGHIYGHEYRNELQRAFFNGDSEEVFREAMKNPKIYQFESVTGNRSHVYEASSLSIDSFKTVEKNVERELWSKIDKVCFNITDSAVSGAVLGGIAGGTDEVLERGNMEI